MFKYADPFALMACAVEMIHDTFARSHQSTSPNMTIVMSLSSMAVPDLKLRDVLVLHSLSYGLNLSIVLSLLTFRWRRSVHAT